MFINTTRLSNIIGLSILASCAVTSAEAQTMEFSPVSLKNNEIIQEYTGLCKSPQEVTTIQPICDKSSKLAKVVVHFNSGCYISFDLENGKISPDVSKSPMYGQVDPFDLTPHPNFYSAFTDSDRDYLNNAFPKIPCWNYYKY